MLLLLLACQRPSPLPDPVAPALAVTVDDVALPYAEVGATPEGTLSLVETGGAAGSRALVVDVEGPFAIEGDRAPLRARESRSLQVRYTGPIDAPVLAAGLATLTVDDLVLQARLGAAIGDPELPELDWAQSEHGWVATGAFPSAPYPIEGGSWADPSVLIAIPPGLSDLDGVRAVTHLHGHRALLERTVATHYLVEQHALSGRDAVLVVPQGPVEASSGDFGRLMDEDGHATLIRDVITALYRDGFVGWPEIGQQVLTAHSGGYLATAAILRRGGLSIEAVHLFDALYGEQATFEAFARDGGVLRSNYTSTGGTADDNESLRAALRAAGLRVGELFDDDALAEATITIGSTSAPHDRAPVDGRDFARTLAESGLPRSSAAPPEITLCLGSSGQALVQWRSDAGPRAPAWLVEGSTDGVDWVELATVEEPAATVEPRPWIRVSAVFDGLVSAPSDRYGATGDEWLVVDGFDRVLGGSWSAPTHDFAARVGAALGLPVSIVGNEAVASGAVDLSDYEGVIWLLGDESTGDVALSEAEQAALASFVRAGGALVLSGSEVGYAAGDWLQAELGVSYVADDAGTDRAGGYTFGLIYPEDYPDVLAGPETIWAYDTGGAAAVRSGRAAVVGFPLETLADDELARAIAELVDEL